MMDIGDFNFKTDFDKQCGEIFLTIKGNMMFHCTLCERIYKDFTAYADHVTQIHILASIEEDIINGINSIIPSNEEQTVYSDKNNSNEFSEKNEIVLVDGAGMLNTMLEETQPTQESSIIDTEIKQDTKDNEDVAEYQLNCDRSDKIIAPAKKRKRKRNANPSERVHKCSLCNFVCNDRSNLLSHTRRHSAEKPHECQECLKRFYTRSELNTHLRIHTGERPFVCTICGRSFKTSGILTEHIKRHKNLRNKECNICGKKFYNKDMLRKHLGTHSDERPYECDICEASFKQPNGLRNHKKLHENKREFQCSLCLARFNQKPGLHSHMKTKHSLRPPLNVPVTVNIGNK